MKSEQYTVQKKKLRSIKVNDRNRKKVQQHVLKPK